LSKTFTSICEVCEHDLQHPFYWFLRVCVCFTGGVSALNQKVKRLKGIILVIVNKKKLPKEEQTDTRLVDHHDNLDDWIHM